jgi:hypothetical protein
MGLPEVKDIQADLLERMREHMVRLGDPALRAFEDVRHVY